MSIRKGNRFFKILLISFFSLISLVAIVFFTFIFPRRTTPILMYHSLSESEEKDEVISLKLNVFARQMEYLSKHNYKIVSLEKLVEKMKEGEKIPDNWVVITFDDGERNFYELAYPIIRKYRFPVTLFVILDTLEDNERYLTWQMLDKLKEDDLVGIGSHSISHQPLTLLLPKQAGEELLDSKLILEERLKRKAAFFSYPFGATNNLLKEMTKEAGYEAAAGSAYQRGEFDDKDIFCLKRVFVSKLSSRPLVFKFMLSGYYLPTRELILKVLNIKTPRQAQPTLENYFD
ncbi:MAG: polysaccharide deacetylase family protein [Candidatus Omnitrophica bacterium]|nr:polysaccharide deacetylase family protein [Candidatus Omnitrophota bacterium]MDD5238614.1 polysaccharide deacetylase family protein [Candidatus Omnitrophota bacterium]